MKVRAIEVVAVAWLLVSIVTIVCVYWADRRASSLDRRAPAPTTGGPVEHGQ